MTIKNFSYGGGVQSNAALVLAAQGIIDYKTFLFCNVGADSENPETLEYVERYAKPYAKAHGIEFIELQKVLRDGTTDTVYQRLTRPNSRAIGIPVRMSNGSPGNRTCTVDFKIKVVDKWLRESIGAAHLRTQKKALLQYFGLKHLDKEGVKQILGRMDTFFAEYPPLASAALGISLDEIQRMKHNVDPDTLHWKVLTYPLITEVSKPLTRQDCLNIIMKAGLPEPPKSACFFCPFHTHGRWQYMRTHQPVQFWTTVDLQHFINKRRESLGLDQVWFTDKGKPLELITSDHEQLGLFDEEEGETCDLWSCFT